MMAQKKSLGRCLFEYSAGFCLVRGSAKLNRSLHVTEMGCLPKLRVPFLGVPIVRTIVVYIGVPLSKETTTKFRTLNSEAHA